MHFDRSLVLGTVPLRTTSSVLGRNGGGLDSDRGRHVLGGYGLGGALQLLEAAVEDARVGGEMVGGAEVLLGVDHQVGFDGTILVDQYDRVGGLQLANLGLIIVQRHDIWRGKVEAGEVQLGGGVGDRDRLQLGHQGWDVDPGVQRPW